MIGVRDWMRVCVYPLCAAIDDVTCDSLFTRLVGIDVSLYTLSGGWFPCLSLLSYKQTVGAWMCVWYYLLPLYMYIVDSRASLPRKLVGECVSMCTVLCPAWLATPTMFDIYWVDVCLCVQVCVLYYRLLRYLAGGCVSVCTGLRPMLPSTPISTGWMCVCVYRFVSCGYSDI